MADPASAESGLPNWATVVRGGVATEKLLRNAYDRSYAAHQQHDSSCCCSDSLYADDIAREAVHLNDQVLRHGKIQTTTVGCIRAIGADVLLTEPPPGHHSIRFPERPSDTQIRELVGCLQPPGGRPNPAKRQGEA